MSPGTPNCSATSHGCLRPGHNWRSLHNRSAVRHSAARRSAIRIAAGSPVSPTGSVRRTSGGPCLTPPLPSNASPASQRCRKGPTTSLSQARHRIRRTLKQRASSLWLQPQMVPLPYGNAIGSMCSNLPFSFPQRRLESARNGHAHASRFGRLAAVPASVWPCKPSSRLNRAPLFCALVIRSTLFAKLSAIRLFRSTHVFKSGGTSGGRRRTRLALTPPQPLGVATRATSARSRRNAIASVQHRANGPSTGGRNS